MLVALAHWEEVDVDLGQVDFDLNVPAYRLVSIPHYGSATISIAQVVPNLWIHDQEMLVLSQAIFQIEVQMLKVFIRYNLLALKLFFFNNVFVVAFSRELTVHV